MLSCHTSGADDYIIVNTPQFAESVTEGDVRWDKGKGTSLLLTTSLILCLCWASCANACGTNRGWWPFCFSAVQNLLHFDARIWLHFHVKTHKSPLFSTQIDCFHMTSRRPYWCTKTMKWRPFWCTKPILWELNSFLM